jgi:hypothetical protein
MYGRREGRLGTRLLLCKQEFITSAPGHPSNRDRSRPHLNWSCYPSPVPISLKSRAIGDDLGCVSCQKESCRSASFQRLPRQLKIVVSSVRFRVSPSQLFPAQGHFHLAPDTRFEAPNRRSRPGPVLAGLVGTPAQIPRSCGPYVGYRRHEMHPKRQGCASWSRASGRRSLLRATIWAPGRSAALRWQGRPRCSLADVR